MKKEIVSWFEKQHLSVREYQPVLIEQIEEKISFEPVVLAACPSSGKTIMSIAYLSLYLKKHTRHRVLILTHGTKVLRSQYHQEMQKLKLDFNYHIVEKFAEYSKGQQVVITLPQTVCNKDIGHFDLIIVDEAHQFYFADTVQNILKRSKCKKQLLLTGTPSEFILRKYNVIAISVGELMEYNVIEDLRVEICSSTYSFSSENYNKDLDLNNNTNFLKQDTESTLNEMLKNILQYLKLEKSKNWKDAFDVLDKTMIVCRRRHQAKQVQDYLTNKNITAALSISKTDDLSEEIENFKEDINCKVLIVVGRGILGFNYPELVNVIDMTCSQNINRIFQLMARVLQLYGNGPGKVLLDQLIAMGAIFETETTLTDALEAEHTLGLD